MQRSELGERAQLGLDPRVDPDRLAELFAAVHDPVPDDIGIAQPAVERGSQLALVDSFLGAASSRSASSSSRPPRRVGFTLLEPALTTSTVNSLVSAGRDGLLFRSDPMGSETVRRQPA